MTCPNCGFNNRAGTLFCEDCGEVLFEQDMIPTRKLTKFSSTKDSKDPLKLHVRGGNSPITIGRENKVVMGRVDEKATVDTTPDLDLSPYGATEHGVSRIHAALDAVRNPPMLIDMGSSNGTFVNGQKLVPNQPRPLHDGDEIRLGRLVAKIYLK